MVSLRSTKLAAAFFATAIVVAGCGSAPVKESVKTSDIPTAIELVDGFDPDAEINFGYTSYPTAIDPVDSTAASDLSFLKPAYDRLLKEDSDGTVAPMLAEEFAVSDDQTTLTLKLREGVTFADGTAFDAEAVRFNLDRYRQVPSKLAPELAQISSVDVVDALTVNISVTGKMGSLLATLASRPGVMISPAAAQSGAAKSAPSGIGPYTAENVAPGDSITFVKSPDYWEPEAQKAATITFKAIADEQTRYNALLTGELDGAFIRGDMFSTAMGNDLQVIAKPSTGTLYIALNTMLGPLGDSEVREAISMALDREGIAQALYDGHCTPSLQPFPPDSIGYSETIGDGLKQQPYDPEAAKSILEEKGLTELNMVAVLPSITVYQKFAEIVQEQLAAIGITLTIKAVPAAQMVQEFAVDKTADMMLTPYTGGTDPDSFINQTIPPTARYNPGGAQYPELLATATEAANLSDPKARETEYAKMMDAWMAVQPHILPVCQQHTGSAYAAGISGVAQTLQGSPDLRYIAKAAE